MSSLALALNASRTVPSPPSTLPPVCRCTDISMMKAGSKLALGLLALMAAVPAITAQCAAGDARCFCASRAAGYYADTTVACQKYYW